jgi:hypothetical protein
MAGDLPLFDPFKALAEIREQNARSAGPELSQKLSQSPARDNPEENQRVDPTLATLATLAGGPSAHELAPARVKEEERKNNLINSYTYAGNERSQQHGSERGPEGVARVARPARVELSDCPTTETVETGTARVSEERAPCPGYRGDEWPRTLARAFVFLDQFGPQAEAMGWTSSRLFGVHETAGIVRVDACGALALPGSDVRAITATEISFGHLTYREKPGQPVGVPWWEWGR